MLEVNKILSNLDYLTNLAKNTKKKLDRTISEIDTQIFLVEPIFMLSGFDIYDPGVIKRASRSSKSSEFDISIYEDGKLLFGIEVKSLSSNEMQFKKLESVINGGTDSDVGKLKREYNNKDKDGVGQLRRYCISYLSDNSRIQKNIFYPILTNGSVWYFFNLKNFVKHPYSSVDKNSICGVFYLKDEDRGIKRLIDFIASKK